MLSPLYLAQYGPSISTNMPPMCLCLCVVPGFVQKYATFEFLFNFISTFEIINKNTFFFVNNLFIMMYNLLTTT